MTENKPPNIVWYRSTLETEDLKRLHKTSDWRGGLQAGGYLGCYVLSLSAAFYSFYHWPLTTTVALTFLHGMVASFMINAVHELTHGTVFATKPLNIWFARLFAFLGSINHEMFQVSHARHHRYTLHQPDDQEVVLPMRLMVRHFFLQGFVNLDWPVKNIRFYFRLARGKFEGEWELINFPERSGKRRPVMLWARILLLGHAAVIIAALSFKLWLLPVLITFAPFYGGCLHFLCNNTQHIGLQDDVPDFRLCCRTFTLNPLVQFLYWHMNFHIEHHMFAAVPCYRLGELHKLIKHDLPPCPHGIVATWKEIAAIQKIQDVNPMYQHVAHLPSNYSSRAKHELKDVTAELSQG